MEERREEEEGRRKRREAERCRDSFHQIGPPPSSRAPTWWSRAPNHIREFPKPRRPSSSSHMSIYQYLDVSMSRYLDISISQVPNPQTLLKLFPWPHSVCAGHRHSSGHSHSMPISRSRSGMRSSNAMAGCASHSLRGHADAATPGSTLTTLLRTAPLRAFGTSLTR